MALPYFFADTLDMNVTEIVLDEVNSRHIAQVLRMKIGDALVVTDGKGNLMRGHIIDGNKRKCSVAVESGSYIPASKSRISIAISLLKNASRFEWFLEKGTEIGLSEIVPIICERTERTHFRSDRMKSILISAMLQSQQAWLPQLRDPVKFDDLIEEGSNGMLKLIAHCEEGHRQPLSHLQISTFSHIQMVIGPEGDFSPAEIEKAIARGYQPVTLGNTRLRSETAGIVALSQLNFIG